MSFGSKGIIIAKNTLLIVPFVSAIILILLMQSAKGFSLADLPPATIDPGRIQEMALPEEVPDVAVMKRVLESKAQPKPVSSQPQEPHLLGLGKD